MPNDPPPPRAESEPDRELGVPLETTNHHQVRDVGRDEEQQQSGQAAKLLEHGKGCLLFATRVRK